MGGRFPSQFSVSMELTNIIPLGSAVATLSRKSLDILRSIQNSGSNLVVEEDLSLIFGRNRLESKLASAFRSAVRESSESRVSDFLDIILEGGAGPTVQRSLIHPRLFATVVQLSLLTFVHQIDELSVSLQEIIERLAVGKPDAEIVEYDHLKGVLLACQQQTTSYPWDLTLRAVEAKLNELGPEAYEIFVPYHARPMPMSLLQGLIDCLPTLQSLSETYFVRIDTIFGISTIVVWAHHVLGLTVQVLYKDQSVKLGQGFEQVVIDCGGNAKIAEIPKLVLFSSDGDEQSCIFELNFDVENDTHLQPVNRHTLSGYATTSLLNKLISRKREQLDCTSPIIRLLAHSIVASCLFVAEDCRKTHSQSTTLQTGDAPIPSFHSILLAGKILFDGIQFDKKLLEQMETEPRLITCSWTHNVLPEWLQEWLFTWYPTDNNTKAALLKSDHLAPARGLQNQFRSVCALILSFSIIQNIESCSEIPLDVYQTIEIHDVTVPTCVEVFNLIARLLLGYRFDEIKVKKAAAISSCGWTLLVDSIGIRSPADIANALWIIKGVPARRKLRKEWIIDGLTQIPAHNNYNNLPTAYYYKQIGEPGQSVELKSQFSGRIEKSHIGVDGSAYMVSISIKCVPRGLEKYPWRLVRLGLRNMQELCWRAVKLPDCDHSSEESQLESILPKDTVTFTGWLQFKDENMDEQRSWIYIAPSVGNSAAQWMLLDTSESRQKSKRKPESYQSVSYLRGKGCCLACAIAKVHTQEVGDQKTRLLIL